MANFYKMGFMKSTVILVKVDKMYSILNSLLAARYWLKDDGEIWCTKFLLEPALQYPFVYYVPDLLRGKLDLFVTSSYYFFS